MSESTLLLLFSFPPSDSNRSFPRKKRSKLRMRIDLSLLPVANPFIDGGRRRRCRSCAERRLNSLFLLRYLLTLDQFRFIHLLPFRHLHNRDLCFAQCSLAFSVRNRYAKSAGAPSYPQ